jgi:hypothetical protein
MNIAQIANNLQQLVKTFHAESFIYDLLLAYGQPRASIKRMQEGGLNLSKVEGEIAWKKKLFFKAVHGEDLHELIADLTKNGKALKHDPRFVVLTDYTHLLAIDTKTKDTLDIAILDIAKHFDFFLPWAGMEKAQYQNENPADVKAAEKMAKLYDDIKKDNPTTTSAEVHNLNVFLSRLLFCFFAEDTGIFEKSQFTNAISSHTQQDGSDLNTYLDTLFEVMNTEQSKRTNLPNYLNAFPYVNGGLFRNKHTAPTFTRKSRQTIIDCGELDWSAINPDIFGSMIQAVITPEHRGGLGMHYTSVPNIMKVIEPLFLHELYEEFETATSASSVSEKKKKLNILLQRLWNIKIFDPACGSGNFLIIAYKELRKLEMKIFKAMNILDYSEISLGNFYGIELDDFAHEVAILSLWLAEHQMNQVFFKEFGRTKPALPLKETGNIVHGNATRLDWEIVCPKTRNGGTEPAEVYILGNPPYLGYVMQSEFHKSDMAHVFRKDCDYKKLDYISCWFYKSCLYFNNSLNHKVAFVSTNSITQGEQVSILWNLLFTLKIEIFFAHTTFKWNNNAKQNAGVSVVIVGLRKVTQSPKYLFTNKLKLQADNINSYLASAPNIIVEKRQRPISAFPIMMKGSQPTDDGNLLLSRIEKDTLIENYTELKRLIKPFIGAKEYIRGEDRYCIWIEEADLKLVNGIPEIKERLKKVILSRLKSTKESTKALAHIPHKFGEIRYFKKSGILVPTISSERREIIPIGIINENTIVSNTAQVVYDYPIYLFGIISSKMLLEWVKSVGGKFKTDYIFSSTLCYNTFPFPNITDIQKKELEKHVYNVLAEREAHSEKTLAQLYDPDKMPDGLREAHRQNDLAVERCYRSKPFESDEERLEYLFKLYELMIAEEKSKGTLFATEAKPKKKKK